MTRKLGLSGVSLKFLLAGLLIVSLAVLAYFNSAANKSSLSVETKSPTVTQTKSNYSDGELVPVLTGGAGAHHSLGGGSSLGGTSGH